VLPSLSIITSSRCILLLSPTGQQREPVVGTSALFCFKLLGLPSVLWRYHISSVKRKWFLLLTFFFPHLLSLQHILILFHWPRIPTWIFQEKERLYYFPFKMSNVTYFKCWVFFWYLCSLNEVYVACSSLGALNSNCLWKCKLMWILLSVAFSTSPIIFGDSVSQYHLSFHVKISCYCSRSENNSFACFFPPSLHFSPQLPAPLIELWFLKRMCTCFLF